MKNEDILRAIQETKFRISKNQVAEAIKLFEEAAKAFSDKEIINELLLLSANFQQYQSEVRKGKISVFDEARNRIIGSCLELAHKLEDELIEKFSYEQAILEEAQREKETDNVASQKDKTIPDFIIDSLLSRNSFNGWLCLICLAEAYKTKSIVSDKKIAKIINASEDYVRGFMTAIHSIGIYRYNSVKLDGEFVQIIVFIDPRISEEVENRYRDILKEELEKHGDIFTRYLEKLDEVKSYFTKSQFS